MFAKNRLCLTPFRVVVAATGVVCLLAAGCGPVSSTAPAIGSASSDASSYRGPTEDRWRATAYVRIRVERPHLLPDDDGTGAVPFDRFMRTELALLRSPVVLQRVASDPELSKVAERSGLTHPLGWLMQHTHVEQVDNSELVTISFDALTELDAANVANMIVDAYVKIASDIDAHRQQQVIDLSDKEMDRRTRELERLRQSVRALVKMTEGDDYVPGPHIKTGGELPFEDRPVAHLKKLLNETQGERLKQETRLSALMRSLDRKEPQIDPAETEQMINEDAVIVELSSKLAEAQREQQAATIAATELPNTVTKPLQDRVAELEQQISARRQTLEERILGNLAKVEQIRRDNVIGDLEIDIEAKKDLENQLAAKIDAAVKEIEKQNNHALDLEFLRQDLERSEAIFKQIANRSEALKTNMRTPDRVGEYSRADGANAVKVRVPRAS